MPEVFTYVGGGVWRRDGQTEEGGKRAVGLILRNESDERQVPFKRPGDAVPAKRMKNAISVRGYVVDLADCASAEILVEMNRGEEVEVRYVPRREAQPSDVIRRITIGRA